MEGSGHWICSAQKSEGSGENLITGFQFLTDSCREDGDTLSRGCTGQEATGANCFKRHCVWIEEKSSSPSEKKSNIGIGCPQKWLNLPENI